MICSMMILWISGGRSRMVVLFYFKPVSETPTGAAKWNVRTCIGETTVFPGVLAVGIVTIGEQRGV
jgi:hypothetical protein